MSDPKEQLIDAFAAQGGFVRLSHDFGFYVITSG